MSAVAQSRPGSINRFVQALSYRPELTTEKLALLASLFFSVFSNVAFWRAIAATGALHGAGGWMVAASLFVMIAALNMLLLCVLLNRWSAKPVLTVLLVVTAMAAHYMNQYTVYMDTDMIRNILHTDSKESGELVTPGLFPVLIGLGVLPSILVWRVRFTLRPLKRALLVRSACLAGSALIATAAVLLSFQDLSALMRNHREVRHLITPGNYLVSLARVAVDDGASKGQPRIPVGTQAKVVGRAATAKPRLLVLVVGETVRAQNWGLNGYARQTTPELAQIGPVNFTDVTACGSSTEVSVPCMFSPYGRAHYDKKQIERSESLLHVLDHAGIATLWRDNQTGCKGVCDGLAFESFEHASDPQLCDSARCLDEIMLKGLARRGRPAPWRPGGGAAPAGQSRPELLPALPAAVCAASPRPAIPPSWDGARPSRSSTVTTMQCCTPTISWRARSASCPNRLHATRR